MGTTVDSDNPRGDMVTSDAAAETDVAPPAESSRSNASRELRARIDYALHTTSSAPGTKTAATERVFKRIAGHGWRLLKHRPALGVVLAGVAGVVAADLIGVGELAVGAMLAYAAYDVLKKHLPFEKAVEQAERIVRP